MPTVSAICANIERFAPPALAADWDNVGLLFGDGAAEVSRLLTCLTVTPAVGGTGHDPVRSCLEEQRGGPVT